MNYILADLKNKIKELEEEVSFYREKSSRLLRTINSIHELTLWIPQEEDWYNDIRESKIL